ncbi:winged helix-turn-helix domain-containing protein [Aneurinibacillus aneurinilyticus]|uniref:winged helix-turn-helix domain-containing protein n=1 Tax=Aneurinibacillus aneurinilyticus TaxID=1391 RepID=UPI002E1E0438|nr:winged helix-turn-helix domain-containing protein [Aneurinibacillus aneurinilyticus]
MAEEFGESTNAVRVELNRLTAAGLLDLKSEGRTKVYQANKNHVLFEEIHSIVKKYIGIDKLIEDIVSKLGNVELAFIIGDYAKGIDSGIIDLIIIGQVNVCYLGELVGKVEVLIKRKVKILVLNEEEFSAWKNELGKEQVLCIWSNQQVLLEGTI